MNDSLTIRNCIFSFKCTANWSDLTPTDNEKISFCGDCQKEVHLCENEDELVKSVRLNRCVAIYREEGMLLGYLVGKDNI